MKANKELTDRLKSIGFEYDEEHDCFIDYNQYELKVLTDFAEIEG